ncbi:hypothetical protein ABH924_003279 [Arthrobacter sp. GAS37]|uniref:hypothetical protein n=1 Tax=Arthrobacter sp. GAS37 TaxID=3156261 RepID=UPI003832F5B1
MPKDSPSEKLSKELETAIKVYKNVPGLEILLFLKDNGPSTFGPIFKNVTDRVRMSVNRNLDRLEDLGVVTVDLPKGQRLHCHPKYDVNRTALVQMGLELATMFIDKNHQVAIIEVDTTPDLAGE